MCMGHNQFHTITFSRIQDPLELLVLVSNITAKFLEKKFAGLVWWPNEGEHLKR